MNKRYLAALLFAVSANAAGFLVYAGAYTDGASRGIYGYQFDAHGGKVRQLGLMASLSNPTFLLAHSDHRYLYAVSEDTSNSVSAFLIDPKSGKLSLVNHVASKGQRPCYLALDGSGRWLAVANAGDGSVGVLPLRKDGGLGEAQSVVRPPGAGKAQPNAVAVVFSPDNRYVLVADFGLDRIYVYRFDAERGSLTAAAAPFATVAPGAGVRRLAFHPNGRILYSANQLRPSVTVYRFDGASGALDDIQTVETVAPSHAASKGGAELTVNAAGTMVYASNGVRDEVALLVVDPLKFTLSPLETTPLVGSTARQFAIDPTGGYMLVANRDSDDISVYTVHPHSGQLRPVGRASGHIEHPACLIFVPTP